MIVSSSCGVREELVKTVLTALEERTGCTREIVLDHTTPNGLLTLRLVETGFRGL